MKKIGIVAGHHLSAALEVKAALLAADPSVTVILDDREFLKDAPSEKIHHADCKIQNFNAACSLQEAGVDVIAYGCGCVHHYLAELQAEVPVPMVDPAGADGLALSPAAYAQAILAAAETKVAKPFKVGMIGGLGPAATVDLYDKIVKFTPAKIDQEHIKVVVEQNPQIPDRTGALLNGTTDPTLALYNCARRLEKDGCSVLIIPCNTAHAFIPYMERHLKVPFVNMQKACLDEIAEKFGSEARIGLMATTGTVSTGIYGDKAKEAGMPMFTPDEENQDKVMQAIYGPKGAKAGFTDGQCWEDLHSAAEYLVKTYDCNVLILGCTELPLIFDEGYMELAGKKVFIIDPTSALARKVVRIHGEQAR